MKFIGLYGEMESGKDTVGQILIENYGYYKVSVGRHIRREILKLDPIIVSQATYIPNGVQVTLCKLQEKRFRDAMYAKPTTPEIRAALQWFGQWWFDKDPTHWLSQVKCEIRDGNHKKIVFTDVRRPNEFNLAAELGEVWAVIRASSLEPSTLRSHITETGLRGYPFKQYVSNNGDLKDLERLIGLLIREYKL